MGINLVKENLCFLYSDQSSIESARGKINLLINILGFNLGEFIFFLSFGGSSVSVIKLSLSSRSRPWTQKSQYLGLQQLTNFKSFSFVGLFLCYVAFISINMPPYFELI